MPFDPEEIASVFEDASQAHVNERGNLVKRYVTAIGSRYVFDFNYLTRDEGWEQYDTDQDAAYFGIWVHEEDHKIITYAEGDLTEVICPDQESYAAELQSMNEFYGPAPPSYRVIDQDGSLTRIYVERPGADREMS